MVEDAAGGVAVAFPFLKMRGAVGDVLSHFLDKNGQVVSHDLEGRLMSTCRKRILHWKKRYEDSHIPTIPITHALPLF